MKIFGIEVDPRKMADAAKSSDSLADPEWLNGRDDKRPTLQDAREDWREAVVRSKTVTSGWPQPKLDVRTVDLVGGMGLALFDRETGQVLPGQRGGELVYDVNDFRPTLTVRFTVDGHDVKLGDNSRAFAQAHDAAIARDEAAMEEAHAENDLQAALRAFGGLTEANRARFANAVGLRVGCAPDALEKQQDTIRALSSAANRLNAAIAWALGEEGAFARRKPREGAYWWRKELRARAWGEG